jgi:cyclopropane fatty-acyl-phospholipid synthase-like methyltransferase
MVMDSGLADPVFYDNWKDFRKMYPRVVSIEVFMDFNSNEIYFKNSD